MRAETLEIQTTRREARRRTVTQKDDTPPVKRAEIYIPWKSNPERTLAALGRRPCPEQGPLSPRDSLPAVSRHGPGLGRYATGFVDSQYPLFGSPYRYPTSKLWICVTFCTVSQCRFALSASNSRFSPRSPVTPHGAISRLPNTSREFNRKLIASARAGAVPRSIPSSRQPAAQLPLHFAPDAAPPETAHG